jgi:hypothetical protein
MSQRQVAGSRGRSGAGGPRRFPYAPKGAGGSGRPSGNQYGGGMTSKERHVIVRELRYEGKLPIKEVAMLTGYSLTQVQKIAPGRVNGNPMNNVKWTPQVIRAVAALSERGVSDTAIVAVMELYEGIDTTPNGIKKLRHKHGIAKPTSGIRSRQVRETGTNRNLVGKGVSCGPGGCKRSV